MDIETIEQPEYSKPAQAKDGKIHTLHREIFFVVLSLWDANEYEKIIARSEKITDMN